MASRRMRTASLVALGGVITASRIATYFYRADIHHARDRVSAQSARWPKHRAGRSNTPFSATVHQCWWCMAPAADSIGPGFWRATRGTGLSRHRDVALWLSAYAIAERCFAIGAGRRSCLPVSCTRYRACSGHWRFRRCTLFHAVCLRHPEKDHSARRCLSPLSIFRGPTMRRQYICRSACSS